MSLKLNTISLLNQLEELLIDNNKLTVSEKETVREIINKLDYEFDLLYYEYEKNLCTVETLSGEYKEKILLH